MALKIKYKNKRQGETNRRSLVKSITWRILATLDTLIISYILTGNIGVSVSLGVLEIIAKMFFYYVHERGWNAVKWGRNNLKTSANTNSDLKIRSTTKAVTWSVLGAVITIAIAYLLKIPIKTSILIGVIEIFTRFIIYFFHERVWNKVSWGNRKIENKDNEG